MLQECNHENMILHIYKKTYFYMHMAIGGIFTHSSCDIKNISN